MATTAARFPAWRSVYGYFRQWAEDGTTDRVHDGLRDADGRDPMASVGILDSQSVKGADTVGKNSRGYDAGKLLAFAQHHFRIAVQIIKRTDKKPTFTVLPRRWVIERTNSWLMQTRRLARDYERLPEHSAAMIK